MKERIKKVVGPIFLSILCGLCCGRLLFGIYEDKESRIMSSNVIYLLEDGTYNDYDTMKASSISSDYIYYEEDGKYNTVIGITKDKDNIDKIIDTYDKELKVSEYLISDKDICNSLEEYDERLKNTTDKEEIRQIVLKMLEIYNGKEDVKMAKIS